MSRRLRRVPSFASTAVSAYSTLWIVSAASTQLVLADRAAEHWSSQEGNALETFTELTRSWFAQNFDAPTAVQRDGWRSIARGDHALLVAPTGSGKTLAAFLSALDGLFAIAPDAPKGVRVVYVSPLKALVYDIERNLRAPLAGIVAAAGDNAGQLRRVEVDVRTGDTDAKERRRQARTPGDILVTTPESLFLLLGAKARENFSTVHTIIVDEIHALAPTKRGAHLALSLERLCELATSEPQRIGLSATVRPLHEVAKFLGGAHEVNIVDASSAPLLDFEVRVPVADMDNVPPPTPPVAEEGGSILASLYARELPPPPSERGLWPVIYPELLREIREHQSTIIFVNSRGLCERLSQRLNELAEEELVRAHHGSVSHESREEIEEALKAGRLAAIVATSSLELGIDMGAVDLVLMVESPGSVARGLQRVGRAGHAVGAVSQGRVYPKFKGDLLESTVIARRMLTGDIEAISVPRNALDVLAQQLVAACCDAPRKRSVLAKLVRRAYSYRELSDELLVSVLDMLSGRYPSTDFADLRPRLNWDRAEDILSARAGAAMISRMNAGTIPDRGNYAVHLGIDGPRLGELDEEMVFESRSGDLFMLGASTWRVEEITRDRVIVSPAPGEPGRLPFWHGDGPGRPIELGRALGGFVREIGRLPQQLAESELAGDGLMDAHAAKNVVRYIADQAEHTTTLPSDRTIVVERFRDELGDWRVCILSPFGSRVHAPWAMALQHVLGEQLGFETQLMYTDDGIVLRFADTDELPDCARLFPDADDIEELVTNELARSSMFAGFFRENAARALLLPRRGPRRRNPLWSQRIKARNLLASVAHYPSFPIVLETYRQCLQDVFDLPALVSLLRDIAAGAVHVAEVETAHASPFARSLVFAYVAAYIYEQDAPAAERKAQALTLDRHLLSELLGQAELREIIDPLVLSQLEEELQMLDERGEVRNADGLHDMLRRLGDLSAEELQSRCTQEFEAWLPELSRAKRVASLQIAGEERWIAAEDAALYRDALGCVPPPGLPSTFLTTVPDALQQVLLRFARTHGPFVSALPAARYALDLSHTDTLLRTLEVTGVVVRGEIRPGGSEIEFCHADVLRRLKRATLAKLRNEVAAVDGATLGTFLPAWHGLAALPVAGSPDRLLEVIAQLEGLSISWSLMLDVLLPQRVPGFTADMLDMLSASGAVVWVGQGRLAGTDGKVALYRRARVGALLTTAEDDTDLDEVATAILAQLKARGALFANEIERGVLEQFPGLSMAQFQEALWSLVWASLITNDTFAPLREMRRRSPRTSRRTVKGHWSVAGRWSEVALLVQPTQSPTERAMARTMMLLDRYGIVSREAALADDVPGGFGEVYKVLKAMEESGKVRRGYFVEGLSGAQFAHSHALERLRTQAQALTAQSGNQAVQLDDVIILCAADPANPYGALIDWPQVHESATSKPRRQVGAWVVLVRGRAIVYLFSGARHLLTFDNTTFDVPDALGMAFEALHRLPRTSRRRSLIIEKVNSRSVLKSEHAPLLQKCGFVPDYRGFAASADRA